MPAPIQWTYNSPTWRLRIYNTLSSISIQTSHIALAKTSHRFELDQSIETHSNTAFSSASSSTLWCGKHVSGEVESESFFSHGCLPSLAQTRIGRVLVVLISGSLNEFGPDNLYTCKLAEGSMKRRTTQCFSTLPSLDNLLSVLVSF